MFIYAYFDQRCGEIQMMKFETRDDAIVNIKDDLKKYWVPWMDKVYKDGIDENEMIETIIDEIDKRGKYAGLYGEADCFSISLKEF